MTDFKADVIAAVQSLASKGGIKASHIERESVKAGTPGRSLNGTLVARNYSTVSAAAEMVLAAHAASCAKGDLRYCVETAKVDDRGGRSYLTMSFFVEDTRDKPALAAGVKFPPKEKTADNPAVVDGKGKS